jgi:hypothetical protein
MMLSFLLLFPLAGQAQSPASQPAAPGWAQLFDGKTLKGWVVEPASQARFFTVRNGVIHILASKDGGWLRSDKKYSDFTVIYEMRYVSADHTGNTGLLLRSPETSLSGRNWPGRGFEVESRDMNNPVSRLPPEGNMLGLQPGAPLGRLTYDTEAAARARRPTGEWNKVEVIAHGNRVWTRFNGEWLSTAYNVPTPDGHIGFQAEDGETEYRNIRILEHSAGTPTPEEFTELFDGKSLNGFAVNDPKYAANATVHDGWLHLEGSGGYLRTETSYTSYVLRLEFRMLTPDALDGIFLRVASGDTDASGWPLDTTVAQLRHQANPPPTLAAADRRWMGGVLYRGPTQGPATLDTDAVLRAYRGLNEWQEAVIEVDGRNVTFLLNGIVIGTGSNVANPQGGYVGLQIGSGAADFRRIEIKGYYAHD